MTTHAPLPQGAPLAAQYLAGVRDLLPADLRHLPTGSRQFRTALAQVAQQMPVPLMPSRRELRAASRYLDTLASQATPAAARAEFDAATPRPGGTAKREARNAHA